MKLSEKAQEYADWLASRGSFEHSDTLVGKHRTFGEDGGPCGENMVYSEGREGAANMSGKDFHIRGLNPVGPSNFLVKSKFRCHIITLALLRI